MFYVAYLLLRFGVAVVAAVNAVVGSVKVALHRLVVCNALMVRAAHTLNFALLVALYHRLVLPAHK
jgi:hypothetical protein